MEENSRKNMSPVFNASFYNVEMIQTHRKQRTLRMATGALATTVYPPLVLPGGVETLE